MAATAGDIGLAAVVGWTLGSPHVGRATYRRLNGYEPVPHQMAPSAALDAWWALEWHLQQGREVGDLVATYLQHWESLERETAIARHNWEGGHSNVGSWCNPWADGSEALARTIIYGAIGQRDPALAGGWAMMDAQCDHGADGMIPPFICARWIASRSLTMPDLENNAEFEEISDVVINSLRAGGPEAAHREVLSRTRDLNPQSALRSFAWIVAGVFFGDGDFSKSILTTASLGGATHHATAVTAAILAAAGSLPSAEWTKPLGNAYVATTVLTAIEPPKSFEDFKHRLNAIPVLPAPRIATPDMDRPTSIEDSSVRPFVTPSHAESALWFWMDETGQTVTGSPHILEESQVKLTGLFRCPPGSYQLAADGAEVGLQGLKENNCFETIGEIEVTVMPHRGNAALVFLDREGRVVPVESIPPT
ncbi:MAG: hypothetical protein KF812_07420 [Fimbriimonadaceae bacterium]|nr:hypothetical protein [Fimbriimonadaceae bacterium]